LNIIRRLTMAKFYDIIKNNLLLVAVMLWAIIFAIILYPDPPKDNKTIIQIELDIDKIDESLSNIEKTIEEIFGKLEIEINTGD
tara:strand:- start:577 stop:828 length:252 start_codon:yes stop_codon:yes gene_type:complete